jgi:hypothetical protein
VEAAQLERRLQHLENTHRNRLLRAAGYTADYFDGSAEDRACEDACRNGTAPREDYMYVYRNEVRRIRNELHAVATVAAALCVAGFDLRGFAPHSVLGYPPDVEPPEDVRAEVADSLTLAAVPDAEQAGEPAERRSARRDAPFEDVKRPTLIAGVFGDDLGTALRTSVWNMVNGMWTISPTSWAKAEQMEMSPTGCDEIFQLGRKVRYNTTTGRIPSNTGFVRMCDVAQAVASLGWHGKHVPAWSKSVNIGHATENTPQMGQT